jgi:ribosomal protein S17E
VGAHQEDEVPPTNTSENDDGIEDDLHHDDQPDDRSIDHVREDPSQVGATGWKDTDNIVRNMNNMGRTRSRTKARERRRLDPGSTSMGGNLAFAAASEIVNEDYHLTEDESEVRAERKKAKDAEYQAHMRNGTWELTPLPKGERCISSGWVETDKRDQNGVIVRRKARFIAKGYSQEFGYDYLHTYAPVASITTIRLILALACILDLELDNMDVGTTYLQSDLEEKIYVKQPPGYEQYGSNGEELVCRLHKSLYGLKQSGRNWHKKIDGWFRGYGFHPSSADPCLYVKFESSGEVLVIVLYVDDLIIASNSRTMTDKFKQNISREFSMKDLKELDWILGMAIKRNRENRTMEISQTAYIDMMLAKFRMVDCKPVLTPMEGTLTRMDGKDVKPDSEYMKLVGSLLYAALVTRPDIAFAVQSLGKHLQGSNEEHWIAAKRVLRYLKGTREVGLKYTGNSTGSFTLVGYADADYAGDKDNRRSTSGYAFTLSHGGIVNMIDWRAKQQDVVALSSAESELISACSATQTAKYIRQLLMDLELKQDEPTMIMEDNQACIAMSNNPITHKRTKHIDVRFHFVREKVESKEVELVYIPTQYQLADILTKPLSNIRLAMIRNRIMGYVS